MTSHRPDRPDAKTPKDLHTTAEDHLQRGTALAKLLQAFIWQYEVQWHTDEPFTLEDLEPPELRIILNILSDELDLANKFLGELKQAGI